MTSMKCAVLAAEANVAGALDEATILYIVYDCC